ncbi:hypothetical protein V493_01459 [Pseudogymnoascus sp. VKM F-4281 (FW-2241)]|nr:hypothetical protein V493_01459 [Pseudogymnoascus sp. VKM F-4281 (FW-2241)]
METDDPIRFQKRSSSQNSDISNRSRRSQTTRIRSRKTPSYASSTTSSISASDKSLTSFPSFSPESPQKPRAFNAALVDDQTALPTRRASNHAPSMVESLTQTSPPNETRSALFDDAPLSTSYVPGAIHLASDEFLERLITRQGAVNLVRQISSDLAQRDAQVTRLRQKAEERERALRKVILECGLSNLDLERRLRAIEELKYADDASIATDSGVGGLETMINDAMIIDAETDDYGLSGEATIRAIEKPKQASAPDLSKGTTRNWKDYIWGGTSKKSSQASSISEASDDPDAPSGLPNPPRKADRRSVLQNGLFHPPDAESPTRASRASSLHNNNSQTTRKPSMGLAAMALKLVAGASGSATPSRDSDASSAQEQSNDAKGRQSSKSQSSATAPRTVSRQTGRTVQGSRRATSGNTSSGAARNGLQSTAVDQQDMATDVTNYGPVEMDTILPFENQPPTVTQVNNHQYNPEFLTDRFGFIYDQRRKKRQKDATETLKNTKQGRHGSRTEMINSARDTISSPEAIDASAEVDERPDTPLSTDEPAENGKPAKKWQDYLKIATFPTELLSHTPSMSLPNLEVMEGEEAPKLVGMKSSDGGFVPPANVTVAVPTVSTTVSTPVSTKSAVPLAEEDIEPVKLLLKQLGEVHDSLQREKTVKWNDFLRKVRAERKRESEAATAAAGDTKSQRSKTVMPEVSIADGEIIGVSGLGNKGKAGRAKWQEFKQLVLSGIPVSYRAKIWAECSGATTLRIPGYYDDLVMNRDGNDDPIIVSQISMDINRTLTDNIFFRRGPGVAKLEEVLLAYSRRNKEVGYCQGMNLITACLLLIMPTAEDAFWLLTSIIENILPQGYYDHSLLASRADQQVLRHYVAELLPKLSKHLDELGIELEALTFQWFLSVFTDCLSAEALFRVWDVVFCINDGSTFLFQVALALLKLNEKQLLRCPTPAGIYTYINHQMTNHAISIDGLIHASEGLRRVVRREDVESRRNKAIEAEKDLIRQREARNNLRKAERQAALKNNAVQVAEVRSAPPVRSPGEEAITENLTMQTPKPLNDEAMIGLG